MREVTIRIAENGDKYFNCPVCENKVNYVEVVSECCEHCIWIWSEVVKRMMRKKDGK